VETGLVAGRLSSAGVGADDMKGAVSTVVVVVAAAAAAAAGDRYSYTHFVDQRTDVAPIVVERTAVEADTAHSYYTALEVGCIDYSWQL